jgi:osmotically-inducible protein OsmY
MIRRQRRRGLAASGCGRADGTDAARADPADRELARRIRQALSTDDSLLASAKTVAIVSDRGTVRLRGSVPSDRERATVADRARCVAGDRRVDDQLRVVRK